MDEEGRGLYRPGDDESIERGGGQDDAILESDRQHDHIPAIVARRQERVGGDQTANDPDHTVDHDERLKITDAPPGAYDVKFVDKTGRTCIVGNVEIKQGSILSIEENRLKNCSP